MKQILKQNSKIGFEIWIFSIQVLLLMVCDKCSYLSRYLHINDILFYLAASK